MAYKYRVRALSVALLLSTLSVSAQAVLMELRWSGKWGRGTVVYDNGGTDIDPTQNQWFFPNSIISFDAFGYAAGSNGKYFRGTGGSIFVQAYPPEGDCPATLQSPCYPSRVAFLLGPATTDGSPRYSLEVRAPWEISRNGWLFPFDTRPDWYESPDAGGAYIASDQTWRTWTAISILSSVRHTQVAAAPLPEPGPLAALAIAFGGFVFGTRRRQKP